MVELDREMLRGLFLADTRENLSGIEQGAMALDDGAGADSEAMAEMLRHAHTLKGNAASMRYAPLAELAHVLEELLHRLKDRRIPDRAPVVSVVLHLVDALRALADESTDSRGSMHPRDTAATEALTIRVDVAKLDGLVNLVGEIAVTRSRLEHALQSAAQDELEGARDAKHELDRLCADLQEGVLGARMVPLGPFLRQYARVARDTASAEDKLVRLVVEGGDVEVDARAMEALREALTHLVRNAVAHGIESPSERIAAGKEPAGVLSLRARRGATGIEVEVTDDGRGVDYVRVRQRAVELGWLTEHEPVSDELLHQLLVRPGFSTSRAVTEISGRGVGMDVVAARVGSLRGRVDVRSEWGHGTTVRMSFPMTISIIDGFSVRVGDQTFVLPLEAIEGCLACPADDSAEDGGLVTVGDESMPFVRLRSLWNLPFGDTSRETLVIVRHGSGRAGLAVDAVLGAGQAVLRPLGPMFTSGGGASAAAFTATGALAILLDVPALLGRAAARARRAPARATTTDPQQAIS